MIGRIWKVCSMLDYVSKYTTLRKTFRIIMMELTSDGLTLINYLHILN